MQVLNCGILTRLAVGDFRPADKAGWGREREGIPIRGRDGMSWDVASFRIGV